MGEKVLEAIPEKEPMELQVINNVHKFEWNFQEIKAVVQSHIEKYHGLVVTEDNLKDMEGAQKELAGVRIKIDGFRKKVKKLLNEPYETFEIQIKELQQLIEKAEKPLKDQVLKYEDQRQEKLENHYICWMQATAKNMGLRDSCTNTNITIKQQWLKRTANDAAVRKEIVTEIEVLLDQQRKDDEAAELQRQKTELIAQLCDNSSKTFMLKTPIAPQDIKHLMVNTGLAEIPGIITEECRKRAEMERKAAEPESILSPVVNTNPPVPPVSPCTPPQGPPVASGSPMVPIPLVMPAPNTGPYKPELWDVTLKLPGIAFFQAQDFKVFLSSNGIKYEVITQERVR